jgi:hypothetical protein
MWWGVSRLAAERALQWLTIVDAISEEAGARFVFFVRNRTVGVADQWVTRWTAMARGKRAVRDAFESYDRLHDAADGVADVLVLVADVPHTTPGRNYSLSSRSCSLAGAASWQRSR